MLTSNSLLLSCLIFLSCSLSIWASPLFRRDDAPSFITPGDAPFSVDAQDLAASLTCPNGYGTADSPPVLLVHGTAASGAETWAKGYVPALLGDGYTACYIDIPHLSMGDMQVNAEYVAYNLHYVSSLSNGLPTAVIAHSQGNPNTQWALQFWPSTRAVTSMFVSLSPDFAGIDLLGSSSLLSGICGDGLCQASMWQQDVGSHYYSALHAHDFQMLVPATSIWTKYDGVVIPAEDNARLPGATVLSVQSLCPARPDTHVTMPISAATYAIALDALQNNGIASLDRVSEDAIDICTSVYGPGMEPLIAKDLEQDLENLVEGFLNVTAALPAEPPIASYAQ